LLNPTVPVVAVNTGDLVDLGVVRSLANPDSNFTGFSWPEFSMGAKWLELLKAIAPDVTRVANIYFPTYERFVRVVEASAASFAVQVTACPIRNAAEINSAVESLARERNGGLIVHPHPVTAMNRHALVELAARHALPAIYPFRGFVNSGGLVYYGIDVVQRWRSTAGYIDLILRGARPADLPVQSTSKMELVINLRTAKALGLKVPPRLIAGADEVIE
jgi:putative tryptophan/tyrosine transport system substrate-binding protein